MALMNLRFAECDVSFHFVDIDFSNSFFCCLSVHVNVHDVFRNCLRETKNQSVIDILYLLGLRTRSRISLCSSLTMKIMSKRERIVVWKSIFCRVKMWRQ